MAFKKVSAEKLAEMLKGELDFVLERYVLTESRLCARPVYRFMEAHAKEAGFCMVYCEADDPEEIYVSVNSEAPDEFEDMIRRHRPCEITRHGEGGIGELRQSFYRRGPGKAQTDSGANLALLSPGDEKLIKSFEGEPECYLEALFRDFAEDRIYGDCHIIGARGKEGDLMGYLAYYGIAENIRDVSYVYVGENHRGKGCGKALLNFFADKNANENKISYYSFADGEISESLAKSCGFACCALRRVQRPKY